MLRSYVYFISFISFLRCQYGSKLIFRRGNFVFLFLFLLVLFGVFYFCLPKSHRDVHYRYIDYDQQVSNLLDEEESLNKLRGQAPHSIRILFWTKIINKWHPEYKLQLRLANGDPIDCEFTNDWSKISRSHMVVFHFHLETWMHHPKKWRVPAIHPWWQKWVYFSQEAPLWKFSFDATLISQFSDQINAFATYATDSDIDARYGFYNERKRPLTSAVVNYTAAGRTKLVAWVASNCFSDTSGRMIYLNELRKYAAIDVIGPCGNYTPECEVRGSPRCWTYLSQHYKFYFAFENSDCHDYITEKLWRNSLGAGIVPIVRGKRNNYLKLAPPFSFIWADEFDSPRQLAEYLAHVHQNDTLYNMYHAWRQKYEIYVNPMISSGVNDNYSDFDRKLCLYAHDHWSERKHYNLSALTLRPNQCLKSPEASCVNC